MNNISSITQRYEQQTILNETSDAPRADARVTPQPVENGTETLRDDKVSLSQASKEMQIAKNAVANTPDVREEKVAQLKQAIANDQYHVEAEKIAESFIGNIISEII